MATRRPFSFQRLYNTLIGGFAPIGHGALGQRASIETQLQYGPALQALVMLGQQTSRQHKQQVTGIRRGGFGAAQGIGQVAQDFQGLLGDTPAPTGEAYGRLGLTRDAVTGALARMQAQQVASVPAGIARARQEFSQNRQDIITQMLQQAQKGALYNAGQYAGYADDRRKERLANQKFSIQQSNELLKAGINPATGKYDPSLDAPPSASERKSAAELKFFQQHGYYPGRGKPGGASGGKPKPGTAGAATQADYKQFHQDFTAAKRLVSLAQQGAGHLTDHQLASKLLTTGVPVVDADGKVKYERVDNEAAAWAAVQILRHGGITKRTAGLLHGMGLTVKQLGYKRWVPKPDRTGRGVGSFANSQIR